MVIYGFSAGDVLDNAWTGGLFNCNWFYGRIAAGRSHSDTSGVAVALIQVGDRNPFQHDMLRERYYRGPHVVRRQQGRVVSVAQYIAATGVVGFNFQRDFDLTDLVNLGNGDVLRALLQCSKIFGENLDTPSAHHADCHHEIRSAVELVNSTRDVSVGLLSRQAGPAASVCDLLQQQPSGPAIAPFASSLFDASGLSRVEWHVSHPRMSLEKVLRVFCLETINRAVEEVISGGGMCPRRGVLVTTDQFQAVYFRMQPEENHHQVSLFGAVRQGRAILICDSDAMEERRHGADAIGTSLVQQFPGY